LKIGKPTRGSPLNALPSGKEEWEAMKKRAEDQFVMM
jgi:hypothetical protein